MKWFVVQVMTGKEECVRGNIQKQLIKTIVPKKHMKEMKQGTWHEVDKVIFPGYVFILTTIEAIDAEMYYIIKSVPGVIKFLGDEKGPISITDAEVNLILRLTQDGDPLGLSEVFIEGGKVTVISGPLQGLEGRIKKLDARRYRAKVDITLMGEPRIVELAVNVIKKSET